MSAFYTQFFCADEQDFPKILDSGQRDNFKSLWLDGLGDLELVCLWQALPDSDSGSSVMGAPVTPVDAEEFLLSTPTEFVNSILSVSEDDIQNVAIAWAKKR